MSNYFSSSIENIQRALKTRTGLPTFVWAWILLLGFLVEGFWFDHYQNLNIQAHTGSLEIIRKIEIDRQLTDLLGHVTDPVFECLFPVFPGKESSVLSFEQEKANFIFNQRTLEEFFQKNNVSLSEEFHQRLQMRIFQEMAKAGSVFAMMEEYSRTGNRPLLFKAAVLAKDFQLAVNSMSDALKGRLATLSRELHDITVEDKITMGEMTHLREIALFFFAMLAAIAVLIQLLKIGASEQLKAWFEENTKTLILLDDVKNEISVSSTFNEALVKSIGIIRERLRWEAGHAYLVREEKNTIVPSNEWCMRKGVEKEFDGLREITEKTEFKIGEGIIGRAVAARKSECISNIKKTDRRMFNRIIGGAPHKIKGAWAFPILTKNGKVVAAFELYSFEEKKPTPDTIRMMEFIGSQLGAAFERKQIETHLEELLNELNERNAALESNASKLKLAKETAERALMQKNKLVSLVSHDLRSPLATIISFAGILLQDRKNPPMEHQKSTLERIVNCCNDQLTMIDELLDVSRLQNRGFEPKYTHENAYMLAISAKQHLSHLADEKGIKLSVDISRDLTLYVDQFLLEGVIKNLIGNAIKFCKKGDEIRVFDLPDKPITLVISDTGIGIEKERVERLFTGTGKTSTSGTSGEKGTGLGLPLCREILEAHGGSITVESTPGHGSKFFLHVPEHREIVP